MKKLLQEKEICFWFFVMFAEQVGQLLDEFLRGKRGEGRL